MLIPSLAHSCPVSIPPTHLANLARAEREVESMDEDGRCLLAPRQTAFGNLSPPPLPGLPTAAREGKGGKRGRRQERKCGPLPPLPPSPLRLVSSLIGRRLARAKLTNVRGAEEGRATRAPMGDVAT